MGRESAEPAAEGAARWKRRSRWRPPRCPCRQHVGRWTPSPGAAVGSRFWALSQAREGHQRRPGPGLQRADGSNVGCGRVGLCSALENPGWGPGPPGLTGLALALPCPHHRPSRAPGLPSLPSEPCSPQLCSLRGSTWGLPHSQPCAPMERTLAGVRLVTPPSSPPRLAGRGRGGQGED